MTNTIELPELPEGYRHVLIEDRDGKRIVIQSDKDCPCCDTALVDGVCPNCRYVSSGGKMTITYTAPHRTLVLTYSDDLDSAEFVAAGFEPSDSLLSAAVDAGGSDFAHDGQTWTSTIS